MIGLKRLPTFDALATDTGLSPIYEAIYRGQSLFAHGSTAALNRQETDDPDVFASLASAIGFLRCITIVARSWLVERQHIEPTLLLRVLGWTKENFDRSLSDAKV